MSTVFDLNRIFTALIGKSSQDDKRGNYVNVVNGITRLYAIVYAGPFFYFGAYFSCASMVLGAAVFAPFVRLFWMRKRYTLAKFICIALTNFYIFTASAGTYHKVGAEYFYLASVMLPLLFFDSRELFNIGASFTIVLACVCLQYLNVYPSFASNLLPAAFPFQEFRTISFFTAFLASAIFVVVYNKLMKTLSDQAIEVEKSSQKQLVQSAKMSALGEMAGGVAHEINNPLAIIRGKSANLRGRLESQRFSEEVFNKELLAIEATVMRIAKVTKGLLAFARNSVADPPQSVLVRSIVDDVFNLCREKFFYATVGIEVQCDENLRIECRPSEIAQILMNLLLNSFDAVASLEEKWAKVIVTSMDTKVVITVIDSGPGIPPAVAEKLMQPFFTTKEVGKGTGIGLSISKGIAETHHGSLRYIDSAPNTTFALELPIHQGPQAE